MAVLTVVLARAQVALQLPLVPPAHVPVTTLLVSLVLSAVTGSVQLVIRLLFWPQVAVTLPGLGWQKVPSQVVPAGHWQALVMGLKMVRGAGHWQLPPINCRGGLQVATGQVWVG